MFISPIGAVNYKINPLFYSSQKNNYTFTANQKHQYPISNIAFGLKTRAQKVVIAEDAMKALAEHMKTGTLIGEKDEKSWLKKLRQTFGTDSITVNNPDNPKQIIKVDSRLTAEKINEGNGIDNLYHALRAMVAATLYRPVAVKMAGKKYSVHNKKIANLLKPDYNEIQLKSIMAYLNKNHVFDMTDNHNYGLVIDKEKGIAKTCGASENWEMSDRAWVTDIMRVGDIQKHKRPETWTKALNTIGEYYNTQANNFSRLIANPQLYREGSPMEGIPHIFMPKTLAPDENWFNNKRLESHGLALKEMSMGIIDGLAKHRSYGYPDSKSVPDAVLQSMDNLSKYFKAIDYSTAPSAGNWEEVPIPGGLTSDTETIRSSLNAYKDLLYNKKYDTNKEVVSLRKRLKEYNPLSKEDLNTLIKQGEDRVRSTYLEEAPGIRPNDASLVFITTSDIKLADDVHEDVKKHVEILESLEKHLVRENGIIRYSPFKFALNDGTTALSPDSYINLNYFNAIDKDGNVNLAWGQVLDQYASKDCSEPNMFYARSKLATPNMEAHWFMVSEMSTGYGKQIEKLVKNAKKENRELTKDEHQLISKLKKKQAEYLNRSLARISDEKPEEIHQIKANGLDMPRVTVSEAHQYVTDTNRKPKMMQGTNAPLAWAVSSLYKALRQESATIHMV